MSIAPVNPRPMLLDLIGKTVSIRLKWGELEYKGNLVSVDSYMNVQLSECDEYVDEKFSTNLGQVLIRCNNVLWIKGEPKKDTEMTG